MRKSKPRALATLICSLSLFAITSYAQDDAADTAEVYTIAKEANNEAVMQHLTAPEHYDAMAASRADKRAKPNENIHVDKVDVEHIDDTHAVARTTFREKHTGNTGQQEFHMELRDGQWQITNPPEAAPKP